MDELPSRIIDKACPYIGRAPKDREERRRKITLTNQEMRLRLLIFDMTGQFAKCFMDREGGAW